MAANDYMWKFYGGRIYDFEELKAPYVVPVIESLPYAAQRPVAIDVGGGNFSIVHSARLPRPRYFRTATVDIAAQAHGLEPVNPTIRADVEEIAAESDERPLRDFLESVRETDGEIGADLIVYSEILNYVAFRSVMRWFDQYLKPGGFTVVANLPTRGWPDLFSEHGVKSNSELLSFVQDALGHTVVAENYTWGATDDYEGFMVLATQKPAA